MQSKRKARIDKETSLRVNRLEKHLKQFKRKPYNREITIFPMPKIREYYIDLFEKYGFKVFITESKITAIYKHSNIKQVRKASQTIKKTQNRIDKKQKCLKSIKKENSFLVEHAETIKQVQHCANNGNNFAISLMNGLKRYKRWTDRQLYYAQRIK
jgi:hypothetical protein